MAGALGQGQRWGDGGKPPSRVLHKGQLEPGTIHRAKVKRGPKPRARRGERCQEEQAWGGHGSGYAGKSRMAFAVHLLP